jgi:hypothetical protein
MSGTQVGLCQAKCKICNSKYTVAACENQSLIYHRTVVYIINFACYFVVHVFGYVVLRGEELVNFIVIKAIYVHRMIPTVRCAGIV